MLKERLQILVSTEQRRRLEAEAGRRGTSIGSVVREAVDAQLGVPKSGARVEAVDALRELRGAFLSPEELERIVDGERDRQAEGIPGPPRQ